MKLPALDDLIQEQRNVYLHPVDTSLFVAGPPGSGKTSVAVHRARYLADNGCSVALITRNRMLVALATQLGDPRVTASTMHRFVSNAYSSRTGRMAPQPEPYVYDWEQLLLEYGKLGAAPAVDHLVIDEAQNLPPGFFRWASRFAARFLDVFADEHQAIDDEHSMLQEIRREAGLQNPVPLTLNHRNTPEIADVAEHFHESRNLAPALVKKSRGGELPRLIEIGSLEELVPRVLTRFRNRRDSVGVIVRSRKEVDELLQLIRAKARPGERVDAYTKDTPRGAEIGIRIVEPGVTVLTGESVIGLEFDSVFLLDLARSLPCRTPTDRRRMYMLCARARDSLVLVNGPDKLDSSELAALPPGKYLAR